MHGRLLMEIVLCIVDLKGRKVLCMVDIKGRKVLRMVDYKGRKRVD